MGASQDSHGQISAELARPFGSASTLSVSQELGGLALTLAVTTIPIGTLVSELGLTYKQGVAIVRPHSLDLAHCPQIVGFTALAAIPTAFVATLGPLTGPSRHVALSLT